MELNSLSDLAPVFEFSPNDETDSSDPTQRSSPDNFGLVLTTESLQSHLVAPLLQHLWREPGSKGPAPVWPVAYQIAHLMFIGPAGIVWNAVKANELFDRLLDAWFIRRTPLRLHPEEVRARLGWTRLNGRHDVKDLEVHQAIRDAKSHVLQQARRGLMTHHRLLVKRLQPHFGVR